MENASSMNEKIYACFWNKIKTNFIEWNYTLFFIIFQFIFHVWNSNSINFIMIRDIKNVYFHKIKTFDSFEGKWRKRRKSFIFSLALNMILIHTTDIHKTRLKLNLFVEELFKCELLWLLLLSLLWQKLDHFWWWKLVCIIPRAMG